MFLTILAIYLIHTRVYLEISILFTEVFTENPKVIEVGIYLRGSSFRR